MSARADIMAFIGANARGFHDAMTRVRGDAKSTAQSAQRDFSALSAGMDRSMGLLKASLTGLGVGLSLQGAKEIIGDIASIDREARRAGVSIKAFQEMKYVAEKNRIDVDAMIDGMKELSLRADEFAVTGKGSASEAFRRLGFGADDVARRLKEPSALFVEIIGRVSQLNKAAQIRIMDELFGGSAGERFVELIAQGEDGIRRVIEEAHQLGIVMDDELVKKAAELDAAFNTIVTTVGSNLKQAVVSVASEIRYVLDLFNTAENRTIATLEQQLAEKQRQRQIMAEDSFRGSLARGYDGGRIPVIDEEISALQRLIQTKKENQKLPERKADEVKLPPTGLKVDDGKSGKSKSISEAERQKKAADELIKSLELEYSLIGQTATQQKLANELRKLGAGATQEQKDRITELITVIEAQKAAQDRANKAQKDFIDGMDQLGADTVDALGNVIAGTEDAADAFKKLAIEIVKSAITGKGAYADLFSSLSGGSGSIGLGGFLGGLLGIGGQKSIAMNGGIGLYARGGISDKPAIFGEAGTEAAVPLPDGRSIPVNLRVSDLPNVAPQNAAPQQGPAGMHVTFGFEKDNEGNLTPIIKGIAQTTFKQNMAAWDKGGAVRTARDLRQVNSRGLAK